MRTLHTIGLIDRSAPRLERRMAQIAAMRAGGIGATLANFTAPTAEQLAATPPGDALAAAASNLLSALDTAVPSEHQADALVLAFQQAFNADAVSSLNSNGKLDTDSAYGPNTQAALNAIVGGIAPAVNTGPAAPGSTTVLPTVVVTGNVPATTTASSSSSMWGKVLLVGAAAFAGWWLFFKKKRRAASNPGKRKGKAKGKGRKGAAGRARARA